MQHLTFADRIENIVLRYHSVTKYDLQKCFKADITNALNFLHKMGRVRYVFTSKGMVIKPC